MELTRDQKKQRPIPTAGTHAARCYAIIDMGTHMESFQNNPPKPARSVQFNWEIPGQTAIFDAAKGPQPMAVFKKFGASIGDKSNLGKTLKSWRNISDLGTSVNLRDYLTQACIVNIIHEADKTAVIPVAESLKQDGKLYYAKLDSVMPIMQGMTVPPLINTPIYFSLDAFTWDDFNKIPEWQQKKITESLEWAGILAKYGANPAAGQAQAQPVQQQTYVQPNIPNAMPVSNVDWNTPEPAGVPKF